MKRLIPLLAAILVVAHWNSGRATAGYVPTLGVANTNAAGNAYEFAAPPAGAAPTFNIGPTVNLNPYTVQAQSQYANSQLTGVAMAELQTPSSSEVAQNFLYEGGMVLPLNGLVDAVVVWTPSIEGTQDSEGVLGFNGMAGGLQSYIAFANAEPMPEPTTALVILPALWLLCSRRRGPAIA